MNEETSEKFRTLTARAVAGDLDEAGAAELAELCRQDPSLHERFASLAKLDRLLGLALQQDPCGSVFVAQVMRRLDCARDAEGNSRFVSTVMRQLPKRKVRRSGWREAWIGLALAAALALGAWIYLKPPAARLFYQETTAEWIRAPHGEKIGTGDRLRLTSGVAGIRFRKGAELMLEGPADLEILAENRAILRSGRAAVNVRAPGSKGFVLECPGWQVTDLGTAFGVRIGTGGEAELQVFEGKVHATSSTHGWEQVIQEQHTLDLQGETFEITNAIQPADFVTSPPPRSTGERNHVHWSFDEMKGPLAATTGRLAGNSPPPARILRFPDVKPAEPWIRGVFGGALSLDGNGTAVETPFSGVTGSAERSVAFWVRVPPDFHASEGYGIISWGELRPGSAWQISVEPSLQSGLQGRLRVGTGDAAVIGTTDLRDGLWHHAAIVLYANEEGSTRVRFFLDGIQESTNSDSLPPLSTSTNPGARQVWLGRNLRHNPMERRVRHAGFFRGDIDEVYIFDNTLDAREIRTLMRRNTPPGA